MKTIFTIFLSFFLAKGCSDTSDIDNAVIEYQALSRGFYKTIKIENKNVSVVNARDEKPTELTLTKQDWKELVEAFREINLENMKNLKAPTSKRLYDGAAHANITISLEGKTYTTDGFDHGYPPVEIENFINKLVLLTIKE
ncbi:hypothetical protein [Flavobacterium filum]|uniref:hypothetical protein n=1 Tax=Flavobacterium TaxID=237 RepID=UPI00041D03BD|nr:hypothetical protein [Flavobacterium filum]MBN8565164.1 hypothetical protein [Flavobacteriales bacterium]